MTTTYKAEGISACIHDRALFIEQLVTQLRVHPLIYNGNQKVELETVNKSGFKKEAVIVKDAVNYGPSANPIFYIDELFELNQNGCEIKEIVEKIVDVAANKPAMPDFDVAIAKALEENVIPVMLPGKGTDEFKAKVPHRTFLDLAVYYKLPIDVNGEGGYITVTNELAKSFGVTEDYLYETAVKGLPESMLKEGVHIFGEDLPILTNKEAIFGSNLMLINDGFERYCSKYDDNLFVLPSSVHELYIVSESQGNKMGIESLKEKVRHGNECYCEEKDVLSYSVYHYNRSTKELTIWAAS